MGLMDKIWDEVFAGPQPSHTVPPERPVVTKSRSINIPESPKSALERQDSTNSPQPSPRDSILDRNASRSFKLGNQAPRITINSRPRLSLDAAHSLPTGFSPVAYAAGIASPGSRKEENVWRGVFHPGSNKAGMDRIGSGKYDKADGKGPSVYDWYNPLTT